MPIDPEKYGAKRPSGNIPIWWIERRSHVSGSQSIMNEYCVRFGLLDSVYPGNVVVRRLEVDYKPIINGIPFKDFETPTEWRKLPCGWNWHTSLFEISTLVNPFYEPNYNLLTKEGVLDAFDDGYLDETGNLDHSIFATEITKNGWRIVRDLYRQKYHPATATLRLDEAWDDGYAARDEAIRRNNELFSTSDMTDHEYNVSSVDRLLEGIPFASQDERLKYRDRILNLPDFDDLEFRYITNDGIQWKHRNEGRWNNLDI